MNAKINTFDIGIDNPYADLRTGLRGIYIPPVRSATGDLSGTDGGYMAGQFYSGRPMMIPGTLQSFGSCDMIESLRCELMTALPIRSLLPFVFTSVTGELYYTEAYFTDLRMDLEEKFFSDFEIDLYAPDPYFYKVDQDDVGSGGWIEEDLFRILGGGYPTPYVLPVDWSPGSSPTIIDNTSGFLVYPQLVLGGKFENPRITNGITGEYLELGLSMVDGDVVVFDLSPTKKTVTLNGVSVRSSLTAGSSFWALFQGENPISLTSDSGDDDGTAIIRYRIPYIGVSSC